MLLSHPTVKNFKNLKIHDRGDRRLEKLKYRHIVAIVGPVATKCGTLTQFYPLDHSSLVALFGWFIRMMSRVHFQEHSLYRLTI